jgi:hypothetical protein
MEKPQFPPATVVTPCNGDGLSVVSVPERLGVVVGMDVHEPRGDNSTFGIDGATRLTDVVTEGDDPPVGYSNVHRPRRPTRSVHNDSVGDDQVIYPTPLSALGLGCGGLRR